MLRYLLLLAILPLAGCGGPASVTHSLVGEWRGRPETSAERTEREWPIDSPDTIPKAVPTDLEALADLQIDLQILSNGTTKLSLDGDWPREGNWVLLPIEGQRVLLDIALDAEGDLPAERRRFKVEFLPGETSSDDQFVLQEEGADPRFGRLLFERI